MVRFALVGLAAVLVSGSVAASPVSTGIDATRAEVVRQSASLLVTTFYRKLPPAAVIAAERDALTAYVHAHGDAHAALPAVPSSIDARSAGDAAVHEVNAAVATRKISAAAAVEVGVKAMAGAARDRYTTYFTSREYKAFDQALDPAKLSGIGVLMDVDPVSKYVRAFFVVPETPADGAGMKSGDLIESIDGHSTHGFTIAQSRKLLLGKSGTRVRLTVAHEKREQTIELTRAQIQPPTVYFSMLPNDVAYIYLAAFGDATPHEFRNAVDRSETAGARAYVLDLRNDGGGRVGTALAVSSLFISSGPIVSIESNAGRIETYEADDTAIAPKPLAILVNGYSASASEITAAALQESGTGVLVGTKTFGKGVVQDLTSFNDGSAIKITTGRYYTPLHHDINGRGIVPNVIVDENANAVFGTPGKDAQLAKALQVLGARPVSRSTPSPAPPLRV
ncbi:MAG TPA: S41 family peptidase [Candidatus Baltobacteraceae bacterium]|nr:S41 family peptidase [Candidatus Baltobacteraceae bacterium]